MGIYAEETRKLRKSISTKKDLLFNLRTRAMVLMVFGSTLISFTGLIIRDMDTAGPLHINLYRGVFLALTIFGILLFNYRKGALKKIIEVGKPGVAAGGLLALAGLCLIQAITTTTVAATLFICASIPFISAFLAWILLGEKISKPAFVTMLIAALGVALMMFSGLTSNSIYGMLMALITAVSFSGYAILLRKNKGIEMLPCLLISGIIISIVCLLLLGKNLGVGWLDLGRCLLLGSFISLIPSAVFIYASRHLIAGELTLFMLLEFSLGPFWVWVFINEVPALWTLFGGSLVISSVLIFVLSEIRAKT